jgi:hypothetical protein
MSKTLQQRVESEVELQRIGDHVEAGIDPLLELGRGPIQEGATV